MRSAMAALDRIHRDFTAVLVAPSYLTVRIADRGFKHLDYLLNAIRLVLQDRQATTICFGSLTRSKCSNVRSRPERFSFPHQWQMRPDLLMASSTSVAL